ncbi:MAG TPA: TlyA family RNA methyltransferase [Kiritimatiellia bacterium]|nr:TlyA family RNA methyltransferase [Kiritimatiellia bacterium]
MTRIRLDQLVVQRGLAESREKAQRLILAGKVRVDGQPAGKPGHAIGEETEITIEAPERFVSRGGEKLEAAFVHWQLSVDGETCLDVGASTGGFTDCLLQHGARRVYAVDVGRAQLHARLAADPRVVVMDGVNARHLDAAAFPERPTFATMDASFISLALLLPAVAGVLAPGGRLVTLIKPQFEAGRDEVGRGGVVRDSAVHRQVVDRVRAEGGRMGFRWHGEIESPLRGPAGNVEFIAYWTRT